MAYTALEAVEIALNLLGKPSSVREITNYILQNKLWKTSGKTPDATVRERIYRDSQKNGKKSKICKVGLNAHFDTNNIIDNQFTTHVNSAIMAGFGHISSKANGL